MRHGVIGCRRKGLEKREGKKKKAKNVGAFVWGRGRATFKTEGEVQGEKREKKKIIGGTQHNHVEIARS